MPVDTLNSRRSAAPVAAPNHNLCLSNRGIWQVHCSIRPTRVTKEKLQISLGTREVEVARARRDILFAWLRSRGVLVQRAVSQSLSATTAPADQQWLDDVCQRRFLAFKAPDAPAK